MWLRESFWHRNMLGFANKTSISSLSDSWLWIYSVNIIHILSIQNTSLNWNIYKFLPHPITLKNITGASELKICIVILKNSNPSFIQKNVCSLIAEFNLPWVKIEPLIEKPVCYDVMIMLYNLGIHFLVKIFRIFSLGHFFLPFVFVEDGTYQFVAAIWLYTFKCNCSFNVLFNLQLLMSLSSKWNGELTSPKSIILWLLWITCSTRIDLHSHGWKKESQIKENVLGPIDGKPMNTGKFWGTSIMNCMTIQIKVH